MDRLVSEQTVIKVFKGRCTGLCHTCRYDKIEGGCALLDEIPVPSVFEGKTNREVLKQIFPNYDIVGTIMFDQYANMVFSNIDYNWLNSPYTEEKLK